MNYINQSTSAIRLGQVMTLKREPSGFERLPNYAFMGFFLLPSPRRKNQFRQIS